MPHPALTRTPHGKTTFYAGVQGIVHGRRPMSDLDGLVNEWRNAAGDKMRGEYTDALAASK